MRKKNDPIRSVPLTNKDVEVAIRLARASDGSRVLAKALVLAIAVSCCILSLGLLALRFMPYGFWHKFVHTSKGVEKMLGPGSDLLPRFLPAALYYALCGSFFLLFRRQILKWLSNFLISGWRAIVQFRRGVEAMLRIESRGHLLTLLLITLIGTIFRITYITEPPRYDESATYLLFASRSLFHVLAFYPAPNNHVFYSLLAWASCRMFGGSPAAWRLPALIAGVILIPLVYMTARRIRQRNAGLYAAALTAVSGPLILYSCDGRGYMIQAVLFALMLNFVIDIVGGNSNSWPLFTVAAVVGFWTAPTMVYAYLTAAAWMLWTGGRRLLRPLLLSAASTAAALLFLYMPILIVSGPAALLSNPWVRPLDWQEFVTEAQRFPVDLTRLLHGGDLLLLPAAIALGLITVFWAYRKGGRESAQLFMVGILVILVTSLGRRIVPFPRVLVPLFSIYYIVAATGWSLIDIKLRHRGAVACVVLLFLGAGTWHFVRSGYIKSYRYFEESDAIARFLSNQLQPCDRLIISLSAGTPLEYDLLRLGLDYKTFSDDDPGMCRVLVAMQRIGPPLPPRGDGLLDPSVLTLPGTLRAAGLPSREFTEPKLIFASGRGQVFELLRATTGGD